MMMKAHEAVKLAMKLNKDDVEWHYVVKHVGIHGKVEVYDENNIYLGELTGIDKNLYQVNISKMIPVYGHSFDTNKMKRTVK